MGLDYYTQPLMEVLGHIPEKHRDLGVACIDCHDNRDMSLKISREFTLTAAFKAMGTDPEKLTRQEMRSAVCAQCHVTYNIKKDPEGKSVGLYFPWQNSKFGAITIEDIIGQIRNDETIREWKQTVTGYKLAFIRHPEYELWTNNSVHFKAGASCADCHMPYTVAGVHKISDHRVMSPVQADLKACKQCHAEGAEWLRERVFVIQDRTVSLMMRAGYATATTAKLFEMAHKANGGRHSHRRGRSTPRPRNSTRRPSTASFSWAPRTRSASTTRRRARASWATRPPSPPRPRRSCARRWPRPGSTCPSRSTWRS